MEINLEELRECLLESIEKKKAENVYKHPLLLYVNHIEAMVKSGARHRDIADFFNRKLGLTDSQKFNNIRLLNVRNYWKKKNIIDFKEVDRIKSELQKKEILKDEIMNRMMSFMKAVHNIDSQVVKNVDDAKIFLSNNYNENTSIQDLAQRYVNKINNKEYKNEQSN